MTAPTRPVPVTGAEPPRPESDADALARLRRENAALKGQLLALASSALAIQPSAAKRAPRRRMTSMLGHLFVLSTGVALGVAWSRLSAPASRARLLPAAMRGAAPTEGDTLAGHIVRQAAELDALAREYAPER